MARLKIDHPFESFIPYSVGVHLPESIGDHMYRMGMISFMIQNPDINKDKLMKICLVHDLAEAIVGDITPRDNVSKEQKKQLELDAMLKITSELNNEEIGREMMDLWLDYEELRNDEAKLAKQLDKLEMIIQADEYERAEEERERSGEREESTTLPSSPSASSSLIPLPNNRLEEYFESTAGYFTDPQIVSWDQELRKKRNLRLGRE